MKPSPKSASNSLRKAKKSAWCSPISGWKARTKSEPPAAGIHTWRFWSPNSSALHRRPSGHCSKALSRTIRKGWEAGSPSQVVVAEHRSYDRRRSAVGRVAGEVTSKAGAHVDSIGTRRECVDISWFCVHETTDMHR